MLMKMGNAEREILLLYPHEGEAKKIFWKWFDYPGKFWLKKKKFDYREGLIHSGPTFLINATNWIL